MMSNWKDINTVPTDRQVLLATSEEVFVGEAYKVDDVALKEAFRTPMFIYTPLASNERTAFRVQGLDGKNKETLKIFPTHWQELPALPALPARRLREKKEGEIYYRLVLKDGQESMILVGRMLPTLYFNIRNEDTYGVDHCFYYVHYEEIKWVEVHPEHGIIHIYKEI